ncbi:hypothetical protein [Rufibacter sp. LB8]|uniref:hypothetical protein n=1 Tax=Rufibacter sp. LB8 TaxID=2777781 RepID=UPI00178C1B2B|nr:hypothetical protein [Rufibacter sp. LB8]
MKKHLMTITRYTGALLLGVALLTGTAACSTGTSEGDVNVEESDFKDKSPTENNAEGTSDNTQDDLTTTGEDSANQKIYDEQERKSRTRDGKTNQGVGGAAESQTTTGN